MMEHLGELLSNGWNLALTVSGAVVGLVLGCAYVFGSKKPRLSYALWATALAVASLVYIELLDRLRVLPTYASYLHGFSFTLGCVTFAVVTIIGVFVTRRSVGGPGVVE
jgi:hypothetical protein